MSATTPKKTKPGNRRKTGKEQYFTPADLAQKLVDEVEVLGGSLRGRTVLEPAGGSGAFVIAAEQRGAKVVSLDIEPRHPGVRTGDFLTEKFKLSGALTISNPPFGRNNALSIPFFNHAAEYSDTIAFIVPQSWRKWSVINRLDRNFHLVADHDLLIDYVDAAGEPLMDRRHLATCFQIWQRRDELRPIVRVADQGIVEKCKPEDADVALVIFGFSCGTVLTEFERVKNTTRMFLKLKHPRALEALQSVDYSVFYKNTAYTPALALPEINYLLNEYLLGDAKVLLV